MIKIAGKYVPNREMLDIFKQFDMNHASSFAEIAIYASACGIPVDIELLKFLCFLSSCHSNVYRCLLDELKSNNGFIDELINKIEFIEFVYSIYARGPSTADWAIKAGLFAFTDGVGIEVRKYKLFSAIDNKFPYLLIKFVAANLEYLVRHDTKFICWFRKRLTFRMSSGENLQRISQLIDKRISEVNKVSMFMS